MSLLRTLMIWMLVLSLPADALASVSMSQCKDMQQLVSTGVNHGMASMDSPMSGHDHAAMMAMTNTPTVDMDGGLYHLSMKNTGSSLEKSKSLGCKCGCKCSGNCAVSCVAMLVTITANRGPDYAVAPPTHSSSVPRGQAHAAYRYDPLRPPSAVAL